MSFVGVFGVVLVGRGGGYVDKFLFGSFVERIVIVRGGEVLGVFLGVMNIFFG